MEGMFWMVMIATVTLFGALLTRSAFKGYTPQQFHCRRCDRGFRRTPFKRMPASCPHCGSTDWAV